MDDESLPPPLRDAAEAYHRPPETPREQMWESIQRGRGAEERMDGGQQRMGSGTGPAHRRVGRFLLPIRPPAPLPLWIGLAAALALAFGLGRLSTRPETRWAAEPSVAAVSPARGSVAIRVAAAEHLEQAESFLTLFRASVRAGGPDRLAPPTARQLLATNRLLLDSPASSDPRLRLLLEDLELVLAGIAQLSPGGGSEDLDLVTTDLERSAVLLRLRVAVPAGNGAPVRPGAL